MTSQQQILDLAHPTLPPPAPPSPPPPSPPPAPAPFAAEQLCYVHCHLCDTVLAVSVPCTSLFKTVTVRCGHCTNLLPVNMRALFLPAAPAVNHNHHHHQLHFTHHNLFSPQNLGLQDEIPKFGHDSPGSLQMGSNRFMGPGPRPVDDQLPPRNPVTNRPPQKRQRVPSAYNRFIKEEIQRIKVENPDISHREAFSAAAKNWAHFPHIHFGLMPDQMVKKTATRPQEGEDTMMKDDFLAASANIGVSPY